MDALTSHYPWLTDSWLRYVTMRKADKVPHALLISGKRGIGKQVLAEQIVASVLCSQPKEGGEHCGHCHSCQLHAAGNHPDHCVIVPEGSGNQIKVDQIRQLKDQQTLKAKVAVWKTVLIAPADKLNINAFNSLLKLLEEPQQNTMILLLTDNSHQLPVTIRSRCQTLNISQPNPQLASEWLLHRLPDLSQDDIDKLLTVNQGAPLASVESYHNNNLDIQSVKDSFEKLIEGRANPIQLSNEWQQYDLTMLFHYLQSLMQAKLKTLLINEPSPKPSDISRFWAVSDCILHTIKLISSSNNLNNTLLIEDFMVSVLQLASDKTRNQL